MVKRTLLALALAGAIFLHAPAQAEDSRDLWLGVVVACWPNKPEAIPCDALIVTTPDERSCHTANMATAQSLITNGSRDHEITAVECIPFTLSAPGRGA